MEELDEVHGGLREEGALVDVVGALVDFDGGVSVEYEHVGEGSEVE